MSVQFSGTTLSLVRSTPVIDPVAGNSTEIEYHGRQTDIISALGMFSGCRCRVDGSSAPLFKLFVVYPQLMDGSTEIPQDTWEIATEPREVDGFAHPLVHAEMEAESDKTAYRKEVEDATDDASANLGSLTYKPKILLEWRRGAKHYQESTTVLRLTRIVSPQYVTKLTVNEESIIYQASDLSIPADVQFALPTLPADPAQAKWGYRLRTQQVRFVYTNRTLKVEQTIEWVLAAWSTLYYTVYSA